MTWDTYGGERTIEGSQFSPTMWILGNTDKDGRQVAIPAEPPHQTQF